MPDTAERGNHNMAIFHFTVKIVGRSKGKSVISASAYLNGDVMKNEETGRISYYTSKKEVVYTSLMMCENAPPEWLHVPEENIKRFQQSIRYKRADDKDAALEKFKITFQKQRLWNEVLKIEKNADAQLGRSLSFLIRSSIDLPFSNCCSSSVIRCSVSAIAGSRCLISVPIPAIADFRL
jgi:hypothetical protein